MAACSEAFETLNLPFAGNNAFAGAAPSPVVNGIYLNTAWAAQTETIRDEILGSSDGIADQQYTLTKFPVIEEEVWVDELDTLTESERKSLVETSLEGGGFTAVATHDEALIERTISFARERRIPNDRFQFQMLYGVRPRLQLDLVARGYDVLVATPYGPDWYRYLMRRLAERPANLLFFLRSLVRG